MAKDAKNPEDVIQGQINATKAQHGAALIHLEALRRELAELEDLKNRVVRKA